MAIVPKDDDHAMELPVCDDAYVDGNVIEQVYHYVIMVLKFLYVHMGMCIFWFVTILIYSYHMYLVIHVNCGIPDLKHRVIELI